MRSYRDAVLFAERQRVNPSQSWYNLCQKFARNCVGADVFGSSAKRAWDSIPRKHKVGPDALKAGMLAYFTGDPGHVVFVVENGYCYSNDIVRRGRIDKVPVSLITQRWGLRLLGGITWTPSGYINLAAPLKPTVSVSALLEAARTDPPKPQSFRSHPKNTATFENALVQLGFLEPKWNNGHFGTETKAAVAHFQSKVGISTSGLPTASTVKAVARRTGLAVAA